MIFWFSCGSKEKAPWPAPICVSFSPAAPVQLPSRNSSFFQAAGLAGFSAAVCASTGTAAISTAIAIRFFVRYISLASCRRTQPGGDFRRRQHLLNGYDGPHVAERVLQQRVAVAPEH